MTKLSEKTYWKIGGVCNSFRTINNIEELRSFVTKFSDDKTLVIGNGTNILFDSKGYDGAVIKLDGEFGKIKKGSNSTLEVGASVWVPGLVRYCSKNGLGLLEHCVGIPASFGGLVTMNGGSQRKAISDVIVSVKVMDYKGNIKIIKRNDCNFGYRKSIFQESRLIILSAIVQLSEIEKNGNRAELLSILKERRLKFPRKEPNCGSVFKSSKELFDALGAPGYIIESLGLKGYSVGGAKISEKHANFIVNLGNASSCDIIEIVNHINKCCMDKYGFSLEAEALFYKKNGERFLLSDAVE